MRTLGQSAVWSYFDAQSKAAKIDKVSVVRKAPGHSVTSYLDLATKIAELQYLNPSQVLLFRGQAADYRTTKGFSALKPTLLRSGDPARDAVPTRALSSRFKLLEQAEQILVTEYSSTASFLGKDRLRRHRILRWAILQHYEVCPTPLLDVTQSLRIAASFASEGDPTHAFVYVLGVPNIGGAITASADAEIQIIRLASVCPPSAVRPHIQEGYLLGEYPDLASFNQKELYKSYEIDFGRRLIAKFSFSPATFWRDDTFPRIRHRDLYPGKTSDPLFSVASRVKKQLPTE